MSSSLHRRAFLSASLVTLVPAPLFGCRRSDGGHAAPVESAASAPRRPVSGAGGAPPPAAGQLCLVTEANIEGPYYRPGAPVTSDLAGATIRGVPLHISGRVLSQDCRSPLSQVTLDVWQADSDGHYDNDGSFGRGNTPLRLRGRLLTAADGSFSVRSILPGRYLNGATYRPAHVHVKLSAAGHRPLTTQLYFPDDPYNDGDPFIHRSLIMQTVTRADLVQARYDFVLAVA